MGFQLGVKVLDILNLEVFNQFGNLEINCEVFFELLLEVLLRGFFLELHQIHEGG